VRRVADLIAEMGSATQEQTTGIGQVSEAVAQLDRVTQQNAALVEEAAAAAGTACAAGPAHERGGGRLQAGHQRRPLTPARAAAAPPVAPGWRGRRRGIMLAR